MEEIFLDPKLQSQFNRDGYIVVPFLDREEIKKLSSFFHTQVPEREGGRGFHSTMHFSDPGFRKKVDVEIKSVVSEKINNVLKGYRPLFSNYIVKEEEGESVVGVHQDWSYTNEKEYAAVNFWCPLIDTTIDNGALHVLPGSHNLKTPIRHTPFENPSFQEYFPEIRKHGKMILSKAGEAIIYHPGLFHFSHPNTSGNIRIAIGWVNIPRAATPLHYHRVEREAKEKLEVFKADVDFYYNVEINAYPKSAEKIEEIPFDRTCFSKDELNALFLGVNKTNGHQKSMTKERGKAEDVAKYYDEWTQRYMDVYGEVIQAFRPASQDELLDYTIQSAGLKEGMRILDAGCGVGAPAMHFASKLDVHIEGITISDKQAEMANTKIAERNLSDKVHIQKGDYHVMENFFDKESFDMVMFLESLGHAADAEKAIRSAYNMLKYEGFVYIKDFFPREVSDPHLAAEIPRIIDAINEAYTYNVLDLHETLTALRKAGFDIVSIKRPEYMSDIQIRFDFEAKNGIDLYKGTPEFMPAEWLEIKCQKWNYASDQQAIDYLRTK